MKLATVALALALTACPPARQVESAADLAAYTAALEDCLQQGKAAKSRAVYRECAGAVDAKWDKR